MPKKIKVVDVASNNEINEDEKPTDNIALPTGKASNDTTDALRVWIVDPALPGNEKAGNANPFNATIAQLNRNSGTNLDPMIEKEIIDSKLEASGLRIFVESEIRFSMSRE